MNLYLFFRSLIVAFVAIFAFAFSSPAISQNYSRCLNYSYLSAECPTREKAIEGIALVRSHPSYANLSGCQYDTGNSINFYFGASSSCSTKPTSYISVAIRNYPPINCPPGSGPNPHFPGECLTRDDCLAKNSEGTMGGVRSWESRCLANGCEVAFDKSASDYIVTHINGRDIFSGTIVYTGNVCTAPQNWNPNEPDAPKPPELPLEQEAPPPQECIQLGNQTACVKPNGDVCATASTGRQICWKPGQTGTKTDRNVLQQKKPGEVAMPPSISIDNGDTADKSKDDIVVREQLTGGRTSTTTIGTYQTSSGADAGGSNQGQPGGQAGGQPGGTGDGDGNGNQNSSTGGHDCDSPPVSSGDALLAQIANQQWLTRCGSEKSKNADVDASNQLGTDADGVEAGLPDNPWDDNEQDINLDSSSVSYGASCPPAPQLGPYGFTWPDGFCNALSQIRILVIALAWLWGVSIVLRG